MIANLRVFAAMAAIAVAPLASADVGKEECIDAHSRGQDARDSGKLSLARRLFMTCAQSACPALVQGDCARFADDLSRIQPSLSFAARDAAGNDLPDTSVYVDDVLVVTRLDDGKPHDVDPGKHVVRFSNAGHEEIVTVVVGAGEKGRSVIANFRGGKGATGTAAPARKEPTIVHPTGARSLVIGGGATMVAGVGFAIAGIVKLPAGCSLSTNHCAASPGDAVYGSASSAAQLVNYGWILGGIGAVAVTSGVVWYVRGAKTRKESDTVVAPWLAPSSAGIAVSGRM
jgi:hypothetical protein